MWSAPEDDEEKGKREAGGGRKGTRRKSERGEMVEEGIVHACVRFLRSTCHWLFIFLSVGFFETTLKQTHCCYATFENCFKPV